MGYYNGELSERVINTVDKIKYVNLPFNNQIINFQENSKNEFIIRDYQQEAFDKLKNNLISILVLPCGCGKTFTASLLAKKYKNIIILSPLRYLALQTRTI